MLDEMLKPRAQRRRHVFLDESYVNEHHNMLRLTVYDPKDTDDVMPNVRAAVVLRSGNHGPEPLAVHARPPGVGQGRRRSGQHVGV